MQMISGNVSPGDPSVRGAGFAINGQPAASTGIEGWRKCDIGNVATPADSNSFPGSLDEFNRLSVLASNSFENHTQDIEKCKISHRIVSSADFQIFGNLPDFCNYFVKSVTILLNLISVKLEV